MQLESLEILEEAGIPRPQALAILRVIDMMIDEAKRNSRAMFAPMDTGATKYDVLSLRQELTYLGRALEGKIEWTRHDLKSEIEWMRRGLEARIK